MVFIRFLKPHIFETVFTDPEFTTLSIILRIGGEIPGVNLKPTNLDPVNIFHLEQFHLSKKAIAGFSH